MRVRTATMWTCGWVLTLLTVGGGCGAHREVGEAPRAAAWPPDPSPDRPIIINVLDPNRLFTFGGEDGSQRIIMARPKGYVAAGIDPRARTTAVLTVDGVISFYSATGACVGSAALPDYRPPSEGETASGALYVGSRAEAVAVWVYEQIDPRARSAVRPFDPCAPPPVQHVCYANAQGKAVRLDVQNVLEAQFTAEGFVIISGPDYAAPIGEDDIWRLIWYPGPDGAAWEARVRDRPRLYPPSAPCAFAVRVSGRYPLHFNADGSWRLIPPSPPQFEQWNPGYVQRAGSFYEKKYLDPAARSLAEAARLGWRNRAQVREALRAYIYDWLEVYTQQQGYMTPPALDECLASLDTRMRNVLTVEQFEAYRAWRAKGQHALAFLMMRPADPADPPAIDVRRLATDTGGKPIQPL